MGSTRVSLCLPNVLSKCAGSVCGKCLPSSSGKEDRRHSRPLAELGAPGPTSPPSQRRPGSTGSLPRRERAKRGIIPFVSPPPAFRGVWHTVGAQQVEKLNTSVMKTWVLIPPHCMSPSFQGPKPQFPDLGSRVITALTSHFISGIRPLHPLPAPHSPPILSPSPQTDVGEARGPAGAPSSPQPSSGAKLPDKKLREPAAQSSPDTGSAAHPHRGVALQHRHLLSPGASLALRTTTRSAGPGHSACRPRVVSTPALGPEVRRRPRTHLGSQHQPCRGFWQAGRKAVPPAG